MTVPIADAATDVQIEPYRPGDAGAVAQLWNRAIGDAFPLPEEVLHQVLERNPSHRREDALIAWTAGLPIGFAYSGLHRTEDPEMASHRQRAFLQAVVVDERWRRRGIGRLLTTQVLQPARQRRVARIEAGGGMFYLWPGAPLALPAAMPFLAALGFQPGQESFDLHGDTGGLDATSAQARLAAEGLRVDAAGEPDADLLLAFLFDEFGGEWWHETRWFLAQGGAPSDVLLMRDRDGAIVGLARIHTPQTRPIGPPHFWSGRRPDNAGGLGPIGIARRLRGQGLGSVLLAVALDRLRQIGLADVVIDCTSLLDFYGRLGFTPWITYRHASVATETVR
jgi:GNAT superfamily N-acetyltransferase